MKKIVIEIADDDYNRINSYPDGKTFYPITARLYKAVKDGTPLPKGHGRLIDANRLIEEDKTCDMWTDRGYEPMVTVETIENMPTVIEVDKEKE